MINAKTIIGVIIIAMLVGVLYVLFEKNFTETQTLSNSQTSSTAEKVQPTIQKVQQKDSLINYPQPDITPAPITGSTDLDTEAESLQMRDYSPYFEQLKDTLK